MNNNKHFKNLFTALILLCATLTNAHDFEVNGIYYNILSKEGKTVEVTYKGTSFNSAIYSGNVIIPENVIYENITYDVIAVGNYAFHRCYTLTDVVIPSSVTSLGDKAFYYCYNLTSIRVPSSVTVIGGSAFDECSRLNTVYIDDLYSWCNIDFWGAFSNPLAYAKNLYVNDEKITELVIPEGITELKQYVFCDCLGITSVIIPNSVTSIGKSAFNYKSLTKIVVDDGNTIYDSRENCNAIIETSTNTLLKGCQNTVIPNSVTSIGENAFTGCYGLTSITIPDGVESIGRSAFENCNKLTHVVIPSSVVSIGDYAFESCNKLTSINSQIPAEILFALTLNVFYDVDTKSCTLYVPFGAKDAYATMEGWNEFVNIVELEHPVPTEVSIKISQNGNITYCSPFALNFSNVDGLTAYKAIGYEPSIQTVTLARVVSTSAGQGIFIKGEPGEYTVPVIDDFEEYTQNLLVGTLEQIKINGTDGEMNNYKFIDSDTTQCFYLLDDNSTFCAGKAYLQIPTAWLPTTTQKSVSIHFDEGKTTNVNEAKMQRAGSNVIYDLKGWVVENPASGIYIVDGKKVIIK